MYLVCFFDLVGLPSTLLGGRRGEALLDALQILVEGIETTHQYLVEDVGLPHLNNVIIFGVVGRAFLYDDVKQWSTLDGLIDDRDHILEVVVWLCGGGI